MQKVIEEESNSSTFYLAGLKLNDPGSLISFDDFRKIITDYLNKLEQIIRKAELKFGF